MTLILEAILSLLSNIVEQALRLLSRVETPAKQTGLHMNNSKTKNVECNQGEGDLQALNGESLKNVDDCLSFIWDRGPRAALKMQM